MTQKATFGAGCFWGVEADFRQISGVVATQVGYEGGHTENPSYRDVCSHTTGHAEVVQVEYDPARASYDDLLKVFWENHDPTQVNRQGPDVGDQYRTVIFYHTPEQKQIAEQRIAELNEAKIWGEPIVTQVVPLQAFYPAEAYHQNYAALHPYQPYIVYNDAPKVEHLRKEFPELYTGK